MSIVLNRVAKASQCLCNTISAANADPENIPVLAKAPSSTTERMFFKRIGTPFPNIQFQRMTLYQLRPEINTVFKVGQVLITPPRDILRYPEASRGTFTLATDRPKMPPAGTWITHLFSEPSPNPCRIPSGWGCCGC